MCRKSLIAAPRDASIHYDLGNALAALGRSDEAVAEFRTALSIKPDFAAARQRLEAVERNPAGSPGK